MALKSGNKKDDSANGEENSEKYASFFGTMYPLILYLTNIFFKFFIT